MSGGQVVFDGVSRKVSGEELSKDSNTTSHYGDRKSSRDELKKGSAARRLDSMSDSMSSLASSSQGGLNHRNFYQTEKPKTTSGKIREKNRAFDQYIKEKFNSLYYHPKLLPVMRKFKPYSDYWKKKQLSEWFGRLFIMVYFVDNIVRWIQYYHVYKVAPPYFLYFIFPCVVCTVLNFKKEYFTFGLLFHIGYDLRLLFASQFNAWYYHGHSIRINELMCKKMAIMGCCFLMCYQAFRDRTGISVLGNLDPTKKETSNKKQSVILVIGRLLMCSLFIFVGFSEIKYQLETAGHFYSLGKEQKQHHRMSGDGHDQLIFKVMEASMCIFVVFGYRTSLFALILGVILMFEAMIQWNFWSSTLNFSYIIHAREHFAVNVALFGGMILLASLGGGQYSVDNWMKKIE